MIMTTINNYTSKAIKGRKNKTKTEITHKISSQIKLILTS